MNRYLPGSILFTGFILLLAVCTRPREEDLQIAFMNPPLEFRMNLNHHVFPLDEEGQDQMIREHLENGYGGFTINVPYEHYLSHEGMEATLSFAEKAKKAGMELWLYDENGYPSGNAGDLVIRENPLWECMGLFFDDTLVKEGPLHFKLPPGVIQTLSAFPMVNGKVDYQRGKDLSMHKRNGMLVWPVPFPEWPLFCLI